MQDVWTRIRHSRTAMVGLAILVFFIGMAVFAQWLAPYGPIDRVADTSNCVPNVSCPLSPPSAQHLLGISEEGADIFSQVIWGSQISLIVGIFSAMVASVLGTAVGLISGYVGGWVDEVMMRFNDVVLSVPWLVLMIVVAARIGTIDLLGLNQAIGGGALVIGGNVWWLVVPGLCLVFLVFGFYLFGFALDEILNPRLRRR